MAAIPEPLLLVGMIPYGGGMTPYGVDGDSDPKMNQTSQTSVGNRGYV
jgi:hypothetical protein